MPTYLSPDSHIVVNDDGNMGFGTADIEAWSSLYRAIQLSDRASIAWRVAGDQVYLVINAYATDEFEWRYRADGDAMKFTVDEVFCSLARASNGLADDIITWTTSFFTAEGQTFFGDVGNGLDGLSVQISPTVDEAVGVGGVWYKSALVNVGNVGVGEDPLFTRTLPANLLSNANECLIFEFWGTTANNVNAKTLRFRFGAAGVNLAFSRALSISLAGVWYLKVEVYRTSATTQVAFSDIRESGSASSVQVVSTLDQTLTADVIATLSGEAVANNDIVLLRSTVRWQPRT